jgi:hypothetical protein
MRKMAVRCELGWGREVKYIVQFPIITYLRIQVDAESKEEAIKLAEQSPDLIDVEHAGGEPRVFDEDIKSDQA